MLATDPSADAVVAALADLPPGAGRAISPTVIAHRIDAAADHGGHPAAG
ncbi:hypothetical protein [Mycolicibacterium vanbaalenii]|nr:hypothetical protein [Mycolicibacterium vanbaalenii]MCV7127074.1 hypothetical protein [Mycolicibacterium vanbaalenii PYR-1]